MFHHSFKSCVTISNFVSPSQTLCWHLKGCISMSKYILPCHRICHPIPYQPSPCVTIRDQANCGSCYAFASMASLESQVRILTNNTVQPVFSPQVRVFSSHLGWEYSLLTSGESILFSPRVRVFSSPLGWESYWACGWEEDWGQLIRFQVPFQRAVGLNCYVRPVQITTYTFRFIIFTRHSVFYTSFLTFLLFVSNCIRSK